MCAKYTSGLIIATVACLVGSSVHRGYIMTELNPLEFQIRNYLKIFAYDMEHLSNDTIIAVVNEERVTVLWAVYSSIFYVGKVLGCFTVSLMADKWGRKNTILIVTGLCGILSLLQSVAIYIYVYPLLLIGRIFDGYGASASSSLTAVYLMEIAPENLRWGFGTADYLFGTSGSIVTAILALPSLLGTTVLWPYVLIVATAPLLPILLLTCQPEGPKFLIQKKKSNQAIISSINHYQGANVDVCAVLEGYEKLIIPTSDRPVFNQLALFGQKQWRKHLVITLALSCGLSFSGAPVAIGYFTSIIADVGISTIDAKKCYLGITVFRTLLSVIIVRNIDKIRSRRSALIFSLWANTTILVSLILSGVIDRYALKSGSADLHTFLVVIKMFLIFMWSAVITLLNPLCALTNLECYSQYQRATANASFLLISYASGLGILLVYPIIQSNIGTCSFVMFLPILVMTTIYLQINVPETTQQDSDAISNAIIFGRSYQSRMDDTAPLLRSNEQ